MNKVTLPALEIVPLDLDFNASPKNNLLLEFIFSTDNDNALSTGRNTFK